MSRLFALTPARTALVALPLILTACSGTADTSTAPAPAATGPRVAHVEAADCAAVYAQAPTAPENAVIVVDATASNLTVELPDALAEQLTSLSRAGGSVSVVSVDGLDGSPDVLLKRAGLSRNGPRDAPSVERIAAAMPACLAQTLAKAHPTTPGTDFFGAAAAAAELLDSHTTVWWLTDGAFNSGQLSVAPDGVVEGDPRQLAAAWGRELPLDFKGRPLRVSGLANSVTPYEPQNRQWLVTFARGLCTAWKASGCQAITAEPADVASGAAAARADTPSTLPADPALEFPVITLQPTGSQGTTDRGCRYTLPAGLLFDGDSTRLRANASAALGDAIDALRSHPRATARIVGHTATDPRASAGSMQRFSERRAQAVAGLLRSAGIAASRLHTSGVGDRDPLAPDVDPATGQQLPEAAAKERRVDITVLGAGCPAP